jgi:hypothetical protein
MRRRGWRRAELILGDLSETVPNFVSAGGFSPIGFIAFDVDLYSSTRSALHCFEGDDALFLPRVVCYFDDLMSADLRYSCEDVGEMLAIREFNDQATRRHRVRGAYGWKNSLLFKPDRVESMAIHHRFDHRRYNDYTGGSSVLPERRPDSE